MKWGYAVTWESMRNPPLTYRGQVEASSYKAAGGKAIRAAAKQKKSKTGFCSVLILIEKLEEDETQDA